ncbi:MAG: flagellar biosynthesis anti-sigma factor FlgM [Erythrobacter sp.]|nr:flagellar biosynthesis anti-sigma factor FlgM [Erythrobacter sp.]
MRIIGLPDFGGTARGPKAVATAAEKVAATQKVAAETRQSEAPIASSPLAAGRQVPVDQDRVAEIRKALQDGKYPLIPAKIADAFIASSLYGKVS